MNNTTPLLKRAFGRVIPKNKKNEKKLTKLLRAGFTEVKSSSKKVVTLIKTT